MAQYKRILAVPGALRIFTGVLLIRGSTIAADFALFWLVAISQDSLALGALAMSFIYLGITCGSPVQGRLSDMLGVAWPLRIAALGFLLAALLFLPFAYLGLGATLALAFLLGFFRPAGQGFGRTSWQVLYDQEEDRLVAATLDSIQSAVINGLAALAAVFLAQVFNPGNLLLAFALLATLSSFWLAASPVAKALRKKQAAKKEALGSILANTPLRRLLLVQLGFFVADGLLVIALLTLAQDLGAPALGGVFILLFLLGALFGAYLFGQRAGDYLNHRQVIAHLLPRYALTLLLLPLIFLYWPLAVLLLPLSGFSRRGFTPSVQTLVQEIVPLKRINEAVALLYVALVLGSGSGRFLSVPFLAGVIYLFLPAFFAFLTWLAALRLKSKSEGDGQEDKNDN